MRCRGGGRGGYRRGGGRGGYRRGGGRGGGRAVQDIDMVPSLGSVTEAILGYCNRFSFKASHRKDSLLLRY